MITRSTRQGLIIATSPQAMAALDELILCCGWPALLHPTPQQFRRELSLGIPKLSLFWLDDERDVATTVQLLTWLGAYQPAVRRIVVGYQLPANVEVAVRSASVQVYWPVDDDIRALVDGLIPQLLPSKGQYAAESSVPPAAFNPHGGLQTSLSASLHSGGPP